MKTMWAGVALSLCPFWVSDIFEMSALPRIATAKGYVRFTLKADMCGANRHVC